MRGFYGVIRLAESLYADIEGSEEVNEEDSRDPVPTLSKPYKLHNYFSRITWIVLWEMRMMPR